MRKIRHRKVTFFNYRVGSKGNVECGEKRKSTDFAAGPEGLMPHHGASVSSTSLQQGVSDYSFSGRNMAGS
jgi:hypothetical protein